MVVVRSDGSTVGCLPAFDLAQPWWMETGDLLAALRERFELDAVVLRLVSASRPRLEPGADVTYAVEPLGPLPPQLPFDPCLDVQLGDDSEPLRMVWARPGGVAADIAWADRELARLGRKRIGPAAQVRTWNLSLLMRLRTAQGVVWLKHVPAFMRHESAVIGLVREVGGAVPTVLAADPRSGLVLLDDVAGEDVYSPDERLAIRMVESLVAIQQRMTTNCAAIIAAGGPNWDSASLLREVTSLVARADVRTDLDSGELLALDQLIKQLPSKLEALYACGLGDTLVHGDFHPGNHRFDGDKLVLLDWADSAVGHPLLDLMSFLERLAPEQVDIVQRAWIAAWSDAYPRANVLLAAELIRPIAALRLGVVYRGFLDAIEESERVYHRMDVATWLRRAVAESSRDSLGKQD